MLLVFRYVHDPVALRDPWPSLGVIYGKNGDEWKSKK